MHGLLSILIWLPIATGLAVVLLGDRNIVAGRWLALLASVATLALSALLWSSFDTGTAALQFPEKLPSSVHPVDAGQKTSDRGLAASAAARPRSNAPECGQATR